MNKFSFCLLLLLISFLNPALAQETAPAYDPLQRNLVFVEGEAEMTVPVNGFELTFGFDVDKSSFQEASQASSAIAEKLAAGAKELGLAHVEVIKGWDLVKQSKISLGSKGRKISNKLILKVLDFPQGQLHDLIGRVIDKNLAVSDAIALEEIRVFVSDEVENKKREELLTQALKTLQSNASRSAEALGRQLSAPKRVFITNEGQPVREELSGGYLDAAYAQASMLSSRVVSVQKSFRVQSEVVDHIKLNTRVFGVYQIE